MFFSRFLSLWRFWLWWQSDCWPCPAMWLLVDALHLRLRHLHRLPPDLGSVFHSAGGRVYLLRSLFRRNCHHRGHRTVQRMAFRTVRSTFIFAGFQHSERLFTTNMRNRRRPFVWFSNPDRSFQSSLRLTALPDGRWFESWSTIFRISLPIHIDSYHALASNPEHAWSYPRKLLPSF